MMGDSYFSDDDVVISGLSIRLPGIESLEKFSTMLFEGFPLRPRAKEIIPVGHHGEFPNQAGKILGDNQLDTIFFGMNAATFSGTDRVQLKAMETSYGALMDAGITINDAQKCVTEVYASASRADGGFVDFSRRTTRYIILGNCRAMAANRVSFFMGVTGQSCTVESANCGGMQALELGWRDVKEGRCDLAVVTSVNILVGESITAAMNDLGWLCKSGHTCAFDNEADGFQRVECYASLVLQRAKNSKRIYAKLHGVCCESVMNFTTSSFKPSRESWEDFLRKFYANSGIDKEKVRYLEAYATGIKDWDTAEMNAVAEVLANNRKTPLMVGSVKSNIGNAEGSADLISIVKAIIAFEHGKVPANKNYRTPSKAIPGLIHGQLKVVDENWILPEDSLIGVNGFSFGNVYGHCILEGFKKPKAAAVEEIPRLALLSARTDRLFPAIFHHIEEEVSFDKDFICLIQEIFKYDIPQHLARGYTILSKHDKAISNYQPFAGEERPIWFVFSGMGSQWPGMGRDLMKLPLARNSIQKCHDILKSTGLDLINILTSDDPNIFSDSLNSFVSIAAIQIALVDILNVLKIVPDGIIGHSLGELGCAYADGSLTLEQTILATYYRGKAVKDATLQRGAMAAIGRGFQQLKEDIPENVELVCHNSSISTTISGLEAPVLKYVDELQKRSIFAKVVEVGNVGFHSQFVAPAGPYLLKYMENIIQTPKLRSSKWISSSVPEAKWKEEAALYSSAEYFTNNLLGFVLFEEACAHVPENAILIEIAPHGLLQAILKRSFPKGVNIPITNRTAPDNFVFLLQAIGKLYVNGINSDIAALYPQPDFPVARKTNSLNKLLPFSVDSKPKTLFCHSKRQIYLRDILKKSYKLIEEQFFHGEKVVPASLYANLFRYTHFQADPSNLKKPFCIKHLRICKPFDLSMTNDLVVESMFLPISEWIEITKNKNTILAKAKVTILQEKITTIKSISSDQEATLSLSTKEFYNILLEKGYIIPSILQYLISVDLTDNGMRGKIAKTQDWTVKLEALMQLVYFNASRREERLVTIRDIGAIEVALANDSNGNDDLDVSYDINTNELACDGIYVKDVIYETHSNTSNLLMQTTLPYIYPSIKIMNFKSPSNKMFYNTTRSSHAMLFVKMNVERFPLNIICLALVVKTAGEYIEFCGQIMSDLKGVETLKDIKVLNLQQHPLPTLSDAIESAFPYVKINSIATVNQHKYDLVLCTKSQFEINTRLVDKFALVSAFANKDAPPDDFAVVSSFESEKGEQISLLKRKIIVNADYEIISIPERDNDLLATLKRRQKGWTKVLLLVGKSEPKEGILNYISRIQSQTSMAVRWMFILDNAAEDISATNPFYLRQLQKDLRLNVLLNGSWNFVYKKQILCERFAGKDAVEQVTSIGREAMSCGDGLTWTVPASWKVNNKDELAAAYVMAYHCLIARGGTKHFDSVLVTDAASVKGQAALAVALSRTKRVFATVGSKDEMSQLQTIFPQLKSDNTFLHSDADFVVTLRDNLLNDFPNIIYNTLDGRVAQDLFAYPAPYTKIFHLGKKEIQNNHTLFTSQFLRYVSLIAMDVNNIVNWHIEDKLEVKKLMDEGIRNGVVQPLKVVKNISLTSLAKDQNIQRLGAEFRREHSFKVKANGSYSVFGDSTGVDLDVAEWLTRRGAKNIYLLNLSLNNDSAYKNKLNLLSLRTDASLQVIEESSVKTFLTDIKRQYIKLEASFYIHFIDQETSPFGNIINNALNAESSQVIAISKNRQFALKMKLNANPEKPCTSIVWNKPKEQLVRNLDLVANYIGDHFHFAIEDDEVFDTSYSTSSELIPSNLESIFLLGAGLPSELKLIEMSNSGLLMEACSPECQPVFIFPGVESVAVEPAKILAQELLSPAFVVQIPNNENMSILHLATTIVPEILKVVDRNVYNLVGLSSGCVLAMEVARQLEQRRKVASLLLVDNPINILKQSYSTLDWQLTILDTVSALSGQEDTETATGKTSLESLPWVMQLSHIVSMMEPEPLTESLIIKGAKHINAYFTAICNYDVADLKLKGPLTVLRSSTFKDDKVAYNEICVDNYIVHSSLSHRHLISSNELRNTINKCIIIEDAAMKTIHEPLWVIFEDLMKQYRCLGKLGVDEKYINW